MHNLKLLTISEAFEQLERDTEVGDVMFVEDAEQAFRTEQFQQATVYCVYGLDRLDSLFDSHNSSHSIKIERPSFTTKWAQERLEIDDAGNTLIGEIYALKLTPHPRTFDDVKAKSVSSAVNSNQTLAFSGTSWSVLPSDVVTLIALNSGAYTATDLECLLLYIQHVQHHSVTRINSEIDKRRKVFKGLSKGFSYGDEITSEFAKFTHQLEDELKSANVDGQPVVILPICFGKGPDVHPDFVMCGGMSEQRTRLLKALFTESGSDDKGAGRVSELCIRARDTGKTLCGRVFLEGQRYRFAIVPAVRAIEQPAFSEYALVLLTPGKLSERTLVDVSEFLEVHHDRARRKTQIEDVVQLQRKIAQANFTKVTSYHHLDADLRSFSVGAIKNILLTTAAHSVCVRTHFISDNSLRILCDETFDQRHGQRRDQLDSIPANWYTHSVNAHAFICCDKEEPWVYIPNVKAPLPEQYKARGLQHVILARSSTMSEIAFALFDGDVAFGVLNIESPIKNAFAADIGYLLLVKQSLEAYFGACRRSNDARWLVERSKAYTNIHDLNHFLNKRSFFNEAQASLLKKIFQIPSSSVNQHNVDLTELRDDLFEWPQHAGLDRTTLGRISERVHIDFRPGIKVRPYFYDSLLTICRNLLDNLINHSSLDSSTRLTVKHFPSVLAKNSKPSVGRRTAVEHIAIWVKTNRISGDEEEKLALVPVRKDRDYHYGMFLVGVLARTLGGTVTVTRHNDSSGNRVDDNLTGNSPSEGNVPIPRDRFLASSMIEVIIPLKEL